MVNPFIAYNQPLIEEDEIKEVIDTLESGWLTMGPKTIEFERLIAEYIGCKNAIAVDSCTAALHLSLIAMGIKPGDEIITSPYTFASTGNVIVHSGAKPVFADIKQDTYNIDPEKIQEAITTKTRAIIPVHYAGQPCDMGAITDIAEDNNLFMVEDGAHAIGSEYENKKIGTFGKATCFSFYVTKNITTGEGGAITTDDDELADKLRMLRLHGISRDAWERYSEKGNWYYEIQECGYKYNISDIHAALGIHQIKKLDKFINIRRKYAKIYREFLCSNEKIILPYEMPNISHVYHLYPILLKYYSRNKFIDEMRAKGIGCSVHFIPLHLHPFYKKTFGFKKGDFPVAEWVYDNEVSLPLYPKLCNDDLIYISNTINEILN
jgi:dTDP-4-amino-4,6-dideoxygalactose transaminase